MLGIDTLRRGATNGLHVSWELAKIIFPIFVIITVLKHTPVLPWIAAWCEPAMALIGLPGEASLILILGYTLNLYAAIGAIFSLSLDPKQITIVAAMLLIAHSLLMETAVAQRTGIKAWTVLVLRLVVSLLSGVLLNILL